MFSRYKNIVNYWLLIDGYIIACCRAKSFVFSLMATFFLLGCTTYPDRSPVPEHRYDDALLLGKSGFRSWGDEPITVDLGLDSDLTPDQLRAALPGLYDNEVNMLAISGGGANGAFAAGLLNGWTKAGDRPVFTVVTGISTGALIAPFAFLGSEYDHVIKGLYTQYSADDLVENQGLLSFLMGSESAFDTSLLREKIALYVDEALVEAIAKEYRRGRFLFIGTTNFDTARPVTWNIGAIASSGHPGAVKLIHDVILASTAIPIAFPPVLIEVEVDGEVYDEMHMDGGVSRQSFLFSLASPKESFDLFGVEGGRQAYVIRNSKTTIGWRPVNRTLRDIAERSANSMVHSQGVGDLYREFIGAHKFGFDFNLAYIPSSFASEPVDLFDLEYMQGLYNKAYKMAVDGFPWEKVPPGIEEDKTN